MFVSLKKLFMVHFLSKYSILLFAEHKVSVFRGQLLFSLQHQDVMCLFCYCATRGNILNISRVTVSNAIIFSPSNSSVCMRCNCLNCTWRKKYFKLILFKNIILFVFLFFYFMSRQKHNTDLTANVLFKNVYKISIENSILFKEI